jgi:phosphocarrier protein HPr
MEDPGLTQLSRSFTIENTLGLHLRPASQLVQIFSEFADCEVQVGVGETRVNGKSIMGLLMLEAGQGTVITIDIAGPGADEILQRVGEVIGARFGED